MFCHLRGLTAKSCYAAKHWYCFLSYCDNYSLRYLEECRKTSRKTDWQTRGNREHERWRRTQTAQQDRRRRPRKREGECVLSHPYRELQQIGAYNHDCQLWLTHQSAERHPLGQKNSITHDPSFVSLLQFQKILLKNVSDTNSLATFWC